MKIPWWVIVAVAVIAWFYFKHKAAAAQEEDKPDKKDHLAAVNNKIKKIIHQPVKDTIKSGWGGYIKGLPAFVENGLWPSSFGSLKF